MRNRRRKNWQIKAVASAAVFFSLSVGFAANAGGSREVKPEYPVKTTEASLIVSYDDPEILPLFATEAAEPTETEKAYESMVKSYDWDAQEAQMLAKIAMAEAEGESVEGKALVILTVLNRVWSGEFPGTIEEVIFQKNQFTTTKSGGRYWTTEPDDDCYEALWLIESGWDESEGAMYFEAVWNTGTWHKNNLQYLFQYGNHIFYTLKEA